MNSNFEEFKLSQGMQENLKALGYTSLTTIQEKVIPVALQGKDLIGQSRTGTGKTAAFLIPIIESLEASPHTQALILAPTRELALQIKEEALKLAKNTSLAVLAVYGGESIENQIFHLKRKAEIVVGTPGRVLDHLQRRTMKLDNLRFFVLDEVDEMLKRGFIDDIKTIAEKAKSEKLQTLLFSATISRETKELADNFLRNPISINNQQKDTAIKPLITQYYLPIRDARSKISNLIDIIHFQDPELAIIFAGTKRMVDIIRDELAQEGFGVERIHSDLSQSKRTSVYNSFKNKKVRFLVATDIAARGIDVEGISHVYNFDFPQDPEFYVRRIGRTGRAGLTGKSVILLNDWEVRRQLPFLERLTGEKIEVLYRPSQEEIETIIIDKALGKIANKIEANKEGTLSDKAQALLREYTSEQLLKGFLSVLAPKRKRRTESAEMNSGNRMRTDRGSRGGYAGNGPRRSGGSDFNRRPRDNDGSSRYGRGFSPRSGSNGDQRGGRGRNNNF